MSHAGACRWTKRGVLIICDYCGSHHALCGCSDCPKGKGWL